MESIVIGQLDVLCIILLQLLPRLKLYRACETSNGYSIVWCAIYIVLSIRFSYEGTMEDQPEDAINVS